MMSVQNQTVQMLQIQMLCQKHLRKTPKKQCFKITSFAGKPESIKDTGLFLSPATEKFHKSIDTATKLSAVVHNSETLKEVRKNIIQSIDHIPNHDLVCENPAAATFVGTIERSMQETKEEFNKVVLSIIGSNIGKDNEGCFPSYKNKKKKQVEKQFKGIAGQNTLIASVTVVFIDTIHSYRFQ